MLKLENGKIRKWYFHKDTTQQSKLNDFDTHGKFFTKYFGGKYGEAMLSGKNS